MHSAVSQQCATDRHHTIKITFLHKL